MAHKKYKKLPTLTASEYEVAPQLNNNSYKLTRDSQLFRDKMADFVINQLKKTLATKPL
jgi:hypothetical protein